MIHFENLTQEEIQILMETVPAISFYVGNADGKFDEDEKAWATRLTAIRSFSGDKILRDFYEHIEKNQASLCDAVVANSPTDQQEKIDFYATKIARANAPLSKLDHKIAQHLYESFYTYGEQIAKLTGGILGFGGIDASENKAIKLSMLNKI